MSYFTGNALFIRFMNMYILVITELMGSCFEKGFPFLANQ